MNDTGKQTRINEQLPRLLHFVEEMHRQAAVRTGDIRVMNAEMQLIRTVGRHDGISVGGAAKELGITKGAVSQTLTRLEKKGGILLREQDPVNASRLRLHLTKEGQRIHEAHERYHRELDALEQEILSEGTEENIAFLERYLTGISRKLDQEHEILNRYLNGEGQ